MAVKKPKPAKTSTIITALHILSREIESGDGVANAVMIEAAERMQELSDLLRDAKSLSSEPIDGRAEWSSRFRARVRRAVQ